MKLKHILLVDDDEGITEILSSLLSEKYEVTVASNGFSALEKMKGTPFDIILLDLLMPGLDGAGFVKELRDRGHATPIVLVSCDRNSAQKAQLLKVADYLLKPFEFDELESKIEAILKSQSAAGVVTGSSKPE
jgi:two-component system response regulator QseB